MSYLNKARSRIPVRPHTVTSVKEDEKKEIEVQFKNQSMMGSVTDVNDAFATGDTSESAGKLIPDHVEVKEEKIPLFKQSIINCSLIASYPTKPIAPPKKYIPNYQKEFGQKKPRKLISIPDELKSIEDEPFPECGLAEEIKRDIQDQLEELKRDSDTDPAHQEKSNVLTDSDRLKEIETRITDLEQKFESLIELLYESQILKGPELEIKFEEYNLAQLNSRLRLHKRDDKVSQVSSQVISEDSDPSLYKQIFYETRQKQLNMSLPGKTKSSLKFNKGSVLERAVFPFEPVHSNYMSGFKRFGTFSRVGDGNK